MKTLSVGVILLSVFFLSGCSIGKYEGQTAEDWFNEYDEVEANLEACVDNYENIDSAIIELDKCVDSETETYKFAYDSCLKTNGDNRTYCYNQVTEMLGHISDLKAKCVTKYVQE